MNKLLDQQIVDVSLNHVGADLIISLVDSGLKGQQTLLRCKEIVILQWHRTPPDDPPYFIPELSWQEVELGAIRDLLIRHRYSFFDDIGASMLGEPPLPITEAVWCRFDRPLVHLHLEGAVCADIVCFALEVEQSPHEAQ